MNENRKMKTEMKKVPIFVIYRYHMPKNSIRDNKLNENSVWKIIVKYYD